MDTRLCTVPCEGMFASRVAFWGDLECWAGGGGHCKTLRERTRRQPRTLCCLAEKGYSLSSHFFKPVGDLIIC